MNVLELRDATVAFDGNVVLDAASLTVGSGTVHALLGQNGSGKSTMLKVLSGVYEPAPGASMAIGGRRVPFPATPDQVRHHGLAIVPQDLGLAPDLTVLETIRLRLFETGLGWRISWRRERRRAQEALDRYGVDVPLDRTIRELPNAARTVIAVVRALEEMGSADQRNVLVLDEPTPHLTPDEVVWLFGIVRAVAAEGTGIVLVTHRLEEIFEVGDEVTVLRDGRVAMSAPVASLERASLTRAVLGYELEVMDNSLPVATQSQVAVRLRVEAPAERTIDLEVHQGEVLGVTGLIGSGWEHVPYWIFGAESNVRGTIELAEDSSPLESWTPRQAMDAGVALIPSDRPNQGALTEFSLAENLSLLTLGRYFRGGRLRSGAERQRSRELAETFDIRPGDPEMLFRFLSGGNQQKALLAKWWERAPQVILLDEPTQGIDVGARAKIYQLIAAAARASAAVLVASVEYDELAKLCTRVVVFVGGVPRVELVGDEVTPGAIAQACYTKEETHGAER